MKVDGLLGLVGGGLLFAEADAGNLYAGQLAAMADGAVITFPAAIFERDHLLVLALLDHFADHARARHERIAVGQFIAIGVQEDVAESRLRASLTLEIG